jgi:hypothetical protein
MGRVFKLIAQSMLASALAAACGGSDNGSDSDSDSDAGTDTDTDADGGSDGGEPFDCTSIECPSDGVLYVDADATGAATGLTWSNALTDLHLGLAIGECCAPAQLWVAAGTYHPTEDENGVPAPANGRTRTFLLKTGVALYGGFTGDETALEQRDLAANETILSGGSDADDDPACVVVTGADDATIDGFTITGGLSGFESDMTDGGGMVNDGVSPVVANCTFSNNSAGAGGGMINRNGAAPVVTSCVFLENWAQAVGGGMYNDSSSPTVTNCTFSRNGGAFGGGAIFNGSSSPTVTNCVFWSSWESDLIDNDAESSPIVTYSDVQGGCTVASGCTSDETGNVDADPLFVNDDPEAGPIDLHLTAGSPCIDTANTAVATELDLEGNPRAGAADMGAYEYQP